MWLETKSKTIHMLGKCEYKWNMCANGAVLCVCVCAVEFVETSVVNGHECDFISYWDKLCQQEQQQHHHYVRIKNLPIASNLLRLLFDFIILTDPVSKRLAQACVCRLRLTTASW